MSAENGYSCSPWPHAEEQQQIDEQEHIIQDQPNHYLPSECCGQLDDCLPPLSQQQPQPQSGFVFSPSQPQSMELLFSPGEALQQPLGLGLQQQPLTHSGIFGNRFLTSFMQQSVISSSLGRSTNSVRPTSDHLLSMRPLSSSPTHTVINAFPPARHDNLQHSVDDILLHLPSPSHHLATPPPLVEMPGHDNSPLGLQGLPHIAQRRGLEHGAIIHHLLAGGQLSGPDRLAFLGQPGASFQDLLGSGPCHLALPSSNEAIERTNDSPAPSQPQQQLIDHTAHEAYMRGRDSADHAMLLAMDHSEIHDHHRHHQHHHHHHHHHPEHHHQHRGHTASASMASLVAGGLVEENQGFVSMTEMAARGSGTVAVEGLGNPQQFFSRQVQRDERSMEALLADNRRIRELLSISPRPQQLAEPHPSVAVSREIETWVPALYTPPLLGPATAFEKPLVKAERLTTTTRGDVAVVSVDPRGHWQQSALEETDANHRGTHGRDEAEENNNNKNNNSSGLLNRAEVRASVLGLSATRALGLQGRVATAPAGFWEGDRHGSAAEITDLRCQKRDSHCRRLVRAASDPGREAAMLSGTRSLLGDLDLSRGMSEPPGVGSADEHSIDRAAVQDFLQSECVPLLQGEIPSRPLISTPALNDLGSNFGHTQPATDQPPKKQRAKRGRATDSHSLAERGRRERINDRLRTLQMLIPDANKLDTVTMLEAAWTYIRKLEDQLKDLQERQEQQSRKLAEEAQQRPRWPTETVDGNSSGNPEAKGDQVSADGDSMDSTPDGCGEGQEARVPRGTVNSVAQVDEGFSKPVVKRDEERDSDISRAGLNGKVSKQSTKREEDSRCHFQSDEANLGKSLTRQNVKREQNKEAQCRCL